MRHAWLALLISIRLAAPAAAEGMTDGDRHRLLAHLKMTEHWVASEVQGLTPQQFNFRMTPESSACRMHARFACLRAVPEIARPLGPLALHASHAAPQTEQRRKGETGDKAADVSEVRDTTPLRFRCGCYRSDAVHELHDNP
jgi:hypothetical protein